MKPQLRKYQQAAVNAIYRYYKMAQGEGNPLIDMCVGSGKSHVIAHFIDGVMNHYPNQRILKLVHVRELLTQNNNKLLDLEPTYSHGVNSASLKQRDTEQDVIYGSIQSCYKHAERFGHRDLVIIDEAHLISKDAETGMYRTLIDALKVINPRIKVIGFTGTCYRMKGGILTRGEGRLFTDIIYSYSIGEALKDGYLVPLVSPTHDVLINARNLSKVGGEYNLKEMDELVNQSPIIREAVRQTVILSKDREHKLVFCSSIEHAHNVCNELVNVWDKRAAVVTSLTPIKERDILISAFKAGRIEYLCNVGVLTTGFDFPALDCGILLRPTASVGLFVQIAGRFLRPHPGKTNALWLDFTSTTEDLGPLDEIEPPPPPRQRIGEPEPVIKLCEECGEMCWPATRICPNCGYEFKVNTLPGHRKDVSLADILSKKLPPKEARVTLATYTRHEGKGNKPPTLRATYMCGLMEYSEWVAFESPSYYGRQRAEQWWQKRTNETPVPSSVDEAVQLSSILLPPKSIKIDMNSKYPRILEVTL